MKIIMGRFTLLLFGLLFIAITAIFIHRSMDTAIDDGYRAATGVAGILLIAGSFAYSLRKKRIFQKGRIKGWLSFHEVLASFGVVLILVHAGTHFEAAVPVAALIFLGIAFVSGLVGRYVHNRAMTEVKQHRESLKRIGLSEAEIGERLSTLAAASTALSQWKRFHMPVVSTLSILTLFHVASAIYYGGF